MEIVRELVRPAQRPKIEIMFNTAPLEVLGEKSVTGLRIKSTTNNVEWIFDVGGLFYAIGHVPNTAFLDGQLELDEAGYIKTIPGTSKTNVEGVFAAGDVQDKIYRQAVTVVRHQVFLHGMNAMHCVRYALADILCKVAYTRIDLWRNG